MQNPNSISCWVTWPSPNDEAIFPSCSATHTWRIQICYIGRLSTHFRWVHTRWVSFGILQYIYIQIRFWWCVTIPWKLISWREIAWEMYTKDVMINHLPFEIFRSIFQQVIAIIEHLAANVMKLVSMLSWPESHLSECLDLLVKWQNQRNRVWSFITVAICNIM